MSLLPQRPKHLNEAAIWQDVEFGSYAADLPLWEELAAAAEGSVLELGAGSGRVALHLARAGVEVMAIERDSELAEELGLRAQAEGLRVFALEADIAESGVPWLAPDSADETNETPARAVGLAIAPLQLMQLLTGEERKRVLTSLLHTLAPGGRLAATLVDESTLVESGVAATPPPDMRELEGWVYSSEPLWVQVSDQVLRMRRLRGRVSPDGDMVRKIHDDVLYRLPPERLEQEASAAGLRPLERRTITSSVYEAGSIAVILEIP